MQESDFIPIRVSHLRVGQLLSFDVYVRLGERHILYRRQGDSLEEEQLQRLIEKKVKHLFIKKEQERSFRQYMNANMDAAYTNSLNEAVEVRAQIIHGALQGAGEDLISNHDSKVVYDAVKSGAQKFVDFVLQEEGAFRSLMAVPNPDFSPCHHGVTVAALASAMAGEMDLAHKAPLSLMVTGALIHDIDHQIRQSPIEQPLEELSSTEKALYHQHPSRGVDILQETGFYDKIVLACVAQHHEFVDGSGFPLGLREKALDPLGTIVATANSFDRLVSFEGHPPKEALKKLLVERMGQHPLEHLQALQEVLKKRQIIS